MIPTNAFIITLLDDPKSLKAAQTCIQSIRDTKSNILPFIFPAVDQIRALRESEARQLEYSYPTGIARGEYNLLLTPYSTKTLEKRIGCFMSHFILWETIAEMDPLSYSIILEQDAKFINQFDQDYFDAVVEQEFICSLNSPIGATRKAAKFDKMLKENYETDNETFIEIDFSADDEEAIYLNEENHPIMEIKHFNVPWIDEEHIPQGLPGNSAYIITPMAAKKLIDMTYQIGIWPNDAMMCKQFFGDMLQCAYPYYTKVQGHESTTSL